jgi:hypothetical protein
MTVQIEVSPEAARIIEALRGNAKALNLTLEAYLQRIFEAISLLQSGGRGEALTEEARPQPNFAMLEALEKVKARAANMPSSGSTEESLKMLREGRAGRMWGDEPTE